MAAPTPSAYLFTSGWPCHTQPCHTQCRKRSVNAGLCVLAIQKAKHVMADAPECACVRARQALFGCCFVSARWSNTSPSLTLYAGLHASTSLRI